ncbi:hypothetical protein HYR99_02700, partial [Candidatus Poribacteria bacterium]|nr:hypothetical protein [Candidatus Poribacteria bacterium]
MENQLYYSQQIWLRENPQTLIMQLAPYTWGIGGKTINLVDHITPVPVQVIGNYLVYKFTYEDDNDWKKWVHENADKSEVTTDLVAVPTGGVFAEAVLGRFNSAEKLDVTRFFDWQDSLPERAPAIAPLKAGEHQATEAPALGAFDKPLVSIQNPIALPDPAGLTSVLNAIAASEIFRNMSGAKITGGAGQAAAEASSASSIAALSAAGTALANTLKSLGSIFSTLGSEKGLSTIGALINKKKEIEQKEKAQAQPSESGPAGGGAGAGGDGAKSSLNEREIVDEALRGTALANLLTPAGDDVATDWVSLSGVTGVRSDVALLGSRLVTEPTFADVPDFVFFLLQLVDDIDLIPLLIRRFSPLDPGVNALQKYNEMIGFIQRHSASLENPERLLFAAEFVKTGVLPDAAGFSDAVVARVREDALSIASKHALTVARSVNRNALDVISAILDVAYAEGVSDVNHVCYMLATAHHESAMGKYMVELANGISTDTVFTKDAYFFGYLNKAPNQLAGDQLRNSSVISDAADIALWNGAAYPDAQPPAVKRAARGCDFYRYIGRGLVQITWRENYQKFSNLPELDNKDFVAHPETVAHLESAKKILVKGMKNGLFTGNKLADYDIANDFDAFNARQIVNRLYND